MDEREPREPTAGPFAGDTQMQAPIQGFHVGSPTPATSAFRASSQPSQVRADASSSASFAVRDRIARRQSKDEGRDTTLAAVLAARELVLLTINAELIQLAMAFQQGDTKPSAAVIEDVNTRIKSNLAYLASLAHAISSSSSKGLKTPISEAPPTSPPKLDARYGAEVVNRLTKRYAQLAALFGSNQSLAETTAKGVQAEKDAEVETAGVDVSTSASGIGQKRSAEEAALEMGGGNRRRTFHPAGAASSAVQNGPLNNPNANVTNAGTISGTPPPNALPNRSTVIPMSPHASGLTASTLTDVTISDGRIGIKVPKEVFQPPLRETTAPRTQIKPMNKLFNFPSGTLEGVQIRPQAEQVLNIFIKSFIPFLQNARVNPHYAPAVDFLKRLRPNSILLEHSQQSGAPNVLTDGGRYLLRCALEGTDVDITKFNTKELWEHVGEGVYVLLLVDGDGEIRGVYTGESCDVVGRIQSHLMHIAVAHDVHAGDSPPRGLNAQHVHIKIAEHKLETVPVLIARGYRALLEPAFVFALGAFTSPAMASVRLSFLPLSKFGSGYNRTAAVEKRAWAPSQIEAYETMLGKRFHANEKAMATRETTKELTMNARLRASSKAPMTFFFETDLSLERSATFTRPNGDQDQIGLHNEFALLKQLSDAKTDVEPMFPITVPEKHENLMQDIGALRTKLGLRSNSVQGYMHIIREGGSSFASLLGIRPELEGLGWGVSWELGGREGRVQMVRNRKSPIGSVKDNHHANVVWNALTPDERKERLQKRSTDSRQREEATRNAEPAVAGFIEGSHKVILVRPNIHGFVLKFYLPPPLQFTQLGLDRTRLSPDIANLPFGTQLYIRVGQGILPPDKCHFFVAPTDSLEFGSIPIEVKALTPGGDWIPVTHGPHTNRSLTTSPKTREYMLKPLKVAHQLLFQAQPSSGQAAASTLSSGQAAASNSSKSSFPEADVPQPSDPTLHHLSKIAFPVESTMVRYQSTGKDFKHISIQPHRTRFTKRVKRQAQELGIPLDKPTQPIFVNVKIVPAKEMEDVEMYAQSRSTGKWIRLNSDKWPRIFIDPYREKVQQYNKHS
ncbi:unnamed protein product [Tilletia controversa]|uniref:Uncharacterized protein n=1 Tax=Tilletia controversa TaxID=13291 RepID=A0A8X7MM68_9BASI|nr:hypothetical protein CF328_g7116 [Tilletia controversa]KAE8240337.1 hypothetical protein A4X06_0g7810 [Tilletia controversa]CAD6963903.1 unnamed protein product [Tilletia controversa]CAD6972828.1 unnamed protein product [Tilletia controversa]